MGIDAKEKTAHNASVGADAGQSIQKDSDNSIPASETIAIQQIIANSRRNGTSLHSPAE